MILPSSTDWPTLQLKPFNLPLNLQYIYKHACSTVGLIHPHTIICLMLRHSAITQVQGKAEDAGNNYIVRVYWGITGLCPTTYVTLENVFSKFKSHL